MPDSASFCAVAALPFVIVILSSPPFTFICFTCPALISLTSWSRLSTVGFVCGPMKYEKIEKQ